MPYIKQEDREIVNQKIDDLIACVETPGDLNYVISRLCHRGFQVPVNDGGGPPAELNYQNLNGLIGVLECVKLELYRTVVAPYEDRKRKENGPVSTLEWTTQYQP